MSQSSSADLSQELAAMSDVFADLGERLLGAARQLHAPGAPPPESLIDDLASSRRHFFELRDRARQHAESLRMPPPPDGSVDSVKGLSSLLEDLAEVEVRHSRIEGLRRRASTALDRVTRISYAGGSEFAPLRDCQRRAQELLDSIRSSEGELPEEAQRLVDGEHPFAQLLTLVVHRDSLDDDLWATLHDAVGQSFGKPLAAAAARSKLVAPPDALEVDASGDDPDGSSEHGRSSGSGRRSLGKATPSPS